MNDAPAGLVYRDSTALLTQTQLIEALLAELRRAESKPSDATAPVASLLAAGALETALADANDPLAREASAVTDTIADSYLRRRPVLAIARVDSWRSSRQLRTSVPEGFAYFALSPRTYAAASTRAPTGPGPVLVIGIRTIGATLSAVAKAALCRSGHPTQRMTVRPTGHPSARRLQLDAAQREVITRASKGHFVIADEGPGNSGSSFLAVAEALLALGVPGARITLLGTRPLDPRRLAATDASRRFARFRFCCATDAQHPTEDHDLSEGKWCSRLRAGLPPIPIWPAAERQKTLSHDGRSLRKFAGLGACGRPVHQRAVALAELGFAPAPLEAPDCDGFVRHAFVLGRPLAQADLGLELADHLGRYIGARTQLAVPALANPEAGLLQMARVNVELELGPAAVVPALRVERLVVPDGRLMPHEWIADRRGRVFKTDAVDHGDDPFFPGPTDPAWDLAGAIVEWKLDGPLRSRMLSAYRRLTGDQPERRLRAFVIAYAAFRARACLLAAHGCADEEATRWQDERSRYTQVLRHFLSQ